MHNQMISCCHMLLYGHNDSAPNFFARLSLLNGECRAVLPLTWANMDGALPGQTVQSWQNRCTNTTKGGFLKWDVNCFSYKVNTVQSTGVNSTI